MPATRKPRTRPIRDWRQFAALLAAGALFGFVLPLTISFAGPVAAGAITALFIFGGGAGACIWGGRVDEVMLAAVKTAWLWAGAIGVAIGGGLAVWGFGASGMLGSALSKAERAGLLADLGGPQSAAAIAIGALAVIAVQSVAFLALWAGWWRSKQQDGP